MDQTEELQLIDVEVANRLHGGQLGHHLCEREKRRGEFTDACLHGDVGWGGGRSTSPCPASRRRRSGVGCAAAPGRPSPGVSEPYGLPSATAVLPERTGNVQLPDG